MPHQLRYHGKEMYLVCGSLASGLIIIIIRQSVLFVVPLCHLRQSGCDGLG